MNTQKHKAGLMERSTKTLGTLIATIVLASFTFNAYAIDKKIGVTYADSSEVYTMVDQMPEILGGISVVYKNIEYPRAALNNRTEGRVFIKFIVDENGNVQDPHILRDIGSGCGEAAIEGIKKVKFKPGVHEGRNVKVHYTMPVTFKIQ